MGVIGDMTQRQPSWDKYESIILLEGLLTSMAGEVTRSDAIKSVSQDLRKMALNRGIEIDDLYRNENGISFQMMSMESAYHGHTIFKPATRLFTEVVNIYHESSDEYQILLKQAMAMINRKYTVKEDFMQYLAGKVSPAQLSELNQCYSEIEAFGLKLKVLTKPLFQTTDFGTIKYLQRAIEQSKLFRITHKKQFYKLIEAGLHYYNYIEEGRHQQIFDVVADVTKHPIDTYRPIEEPLAVVTVAENSVDVPLTRSEQDERLLQKYPIIYKRLFNALKNSFFESTSSVPIEEMNEQIGGIARPSAIEEILDNASWSMAVGENYVFSVEVVDQGVVINEPDDEVVARASCDDTICEINFNGSFDLSYTKPEGFSYFGKKNECGNSWATLYVNFMAAIIDDYPHIFKAGISFSNYSGRVDLANSTDYGFMVAPKPVPGTDYMLETDMCASEIANQIRYVLDLCNVDYENILITCSKKTAPQGSVESRNRPALTSESKVVNSKTFSQYMENTLKMAAATCRSYSSAINNCEAFAREHQLSSWRLYTADKDEAKETARLLLCNDDFLNYNARQNNRLRAALQKFFAFIETDLPQTILVEQASQSIANYRNEAYEDVLKQYFLKGFRMESYLEIRKFRKYYAAIHNAELSDSDAEIDKNIRLLCIVHEGKAFLPEVMLSEELKEKLLKYIEDAFADGKTAIYYQAIYAEFAETFLDYHIHDADMLKSYLKLVGSGRFFINRSCISKEPNITLDMLSEVRSCLQGYGRPMEYGELFDALPHLPQSKVKNVLASNGEFVNNGSGTYFHESIVHLSDEELEVIADIIRQTVEEKEFISGNELHDAISAKYPYMIEDNHDLSIYGFRDALKTKLGDRFSFKGNIISRSEQGLSMAEVFAKYARTHDSFTLSELQGLAANLGTSISVYFEPIYENSLRINKDQFVSKGLAQFSVSDTDEVLDSICVGEYIPIQEVTNFGIFPHAGFPWNSFLLEHYVANYSQKYMLIPSSFNSSVCVGAIVKRSSGISNLDDLIVDLLVNNSIEMKKGPVLQFLSDKGYIARRIYTGIEVLIIKANAQRQKKDKY